MAKTGAPEEPADCATLSPRTDSSLLDGESAAGPVDDGQSRQDSDEPRPTSLLSMTSMSPSSPGTLLSSRPTSYGSLEGDPASASRVSQGISSSPLTASQQRRPSSRKVDMSPPNHYLMRSRRHSAPMQGQLLLNHPDTVAASKLPRSVIPFPGRTKRASAVPSISELEAYVDTGADAPDVPSDGLDSGIVERRRLRIKSSASSRVERALPHDRAPSSRSSSIQGMGRDHHEASSRLRPVSMALPAISPLFASSVCVSVTTDETAQESAYASTKDRGLLPQPIIRAQGNAAGRAVRFSMPPGSVTRTLISKEAYNTAKRTARSAKRDRIAREILDSERVYVGVLNEIHEQFLSPLLRAASSTDPTIKPILSNQTIRTIFSNFEDVRVLSIEILRKLEAGVPSRPVTIGSSRFVIPTAQNLFGSTSQQGNLGSASALVPDGTLGPSNVGHILAPILPFLKCYALFVQNFSKSQESLQEQADLNPAWREFLRERKAKGHGQNLGISAMLLCVVQRIPRYRLLLSDLLRYTDPDDVDYGPLVEALQTTEEVAQHLDSSVKQQQSALEILDLQKSMLELDVNLIEPGRRLLKSANFIKQSRKGEKNVAFFLFTDALLYAEVQPAWTHGLPIPGRARAVSNGAAKHHRGRISSSSASDLKPSVLNSGSVYTFRRLLDLSDVTVSAGVGDRAFELRSSIKSFLVTASSADVRNEWLEAIREAKEELLASRRSLAAEGASTLRAVQISTAESARPTLPSNGTQELKHTSTGGEAVQLSRNASHDHQMNAMHHLDSRRQSATPATNAEAAHQNYWGTSAMTKMGKLKLYHNYSAPIWIPDNRADRCMRCREHFSPWRRKHHCRLCGDVVCWACSTKSFAIPGATSKDPPRIERACHDCYLTCFGVPAEDQPEGHGNPVDAPNQPEAVPTEPNGRSARGPRASGRRFSSSVEMLRSIIGL